MPTLLVVRADGGFLPKGWVSSILPDGAEPTDYEKSGGLWKVVNVTSGKDLEIRGRSADGVPALRGLSYDRGSITEVREPIDAYRTRMASTVPPRPVPGPACLDRSQSTVWDYGPGRTYSTPQAAFDALVAQEGSADFGETHYIRGWSGVYGQDVSGAVLALATVSPTRTHNLLVDARAGESVTFDGEDGDVCLIGQSVGRVLVKGLSFANGLHAIFPAHPDGTEVTGWRIEDCRADGTGSTIWVAVSIHKAGALSVRRCVFDNIRLHAIGPGFITDASHSVSLLIAGCKLSAAEKAVSSNATLNLFAANNTFQFGEAGIHIADTAEATIVAMDNNVFTASDGDTSCVRSDSLADIPLEVMMADGNCYWPGSEGAMASLMGTDYDLAAWRAMFHCDTNSFSNDPLLGPDLAPLRGSPCVGAGVAGDRADLEGNIRATTVDIGYRQVTEPFTPTPRPRREPEIARR